MKKSEYLKRFALRILVFVMFAAAGLNAGFMTVVHANETETKSITGFRTGAIENPSNGNTEGLTGWTGSYVYYGKYNSNSVKYRVLSKNTGDFGGTTMLLDCDSILLKKKFDDNTNLWADSELKAWLNGNEFLGNTGVFTSLEKSAINFSTKSSFTHDGSGSNHLEQANLTGEQIFLLDAKEATRADYGYKNTDSKDSTRHKSGEDTSGWWLRSPGSNHDNYAGRVNANGNVYLDYVGFDYVGVSPALNVNLSSVLFSSLISGTAGQAGAEYKLTLLDSDMTISEGTDGVSRSGYTITVPYTVDGNNAGKATQVSVLITDSIYTPGAAATNGYTYLKLNTTGDFATTGTGTFKLPEEYAFKRCGTDYYAYILAEDVNGEKETDYASAPVEITIPLLYDTLMNTATPVKFNGIDWYIIADDSTAGGAGTVTLLAKDPIDMKPFNDSTDKGNQYSTSDIKRYLDGLTTKKGSFAGVADAIVTISSLETNKYSEGYNSTDVYDMATNVKLYLLSAEEANELPSGIRICSKEGNGRANYWWLRSPSYRDGYASFVASVSGNVYGRPVTWTQGIRPALKLDLSSVVFSLDTNTFMVDTNTSMEDTDTSMEKQYTSFIPNDSDSTETLVDKVVKFNDIDWYIIADDSTAENAGTVTLLAKEPIGASKFNEKDYNGNNYSTSEVKSYLDRLTTGDGSFADVADAIVTIPSLTTNKFKSTEIYDKATNVKLYLLSTEEAINLPMIIKKCSGATDAKSNIWWLRSPGDCDGNAACVFGEYGYVNVDGNVNEDGNIIEKFGVRPALKLDLSSVRFLDNAFLKRVSHKPKEPAFVTNAPNAKTLTCTGSAQELVTAGTAEGGTMQYALGTDATTAPADDLYTTSIPTATDAGTYYVWYKVVGDSKHYDSDAYNILVTIAKAAQDNSKKTASEPREITVKISTKSKNFKASALKKKARTFRIKYKKTKGSGKAVFTKVRGSKKLTVSKAGTVKIKKGTGKGTYKIKVRITVAANKTHKAGTAVRTIKVKIK